MIAPRSSASSSSFRPLLPVPEPVPEPKISLRALPVALPRARAPLNVPRAGEDNVPRADEAASRRVGDGDNDDVDEDDADDEEEVERDGDGGEGRGVLEEGG